MPQEIKSINGFPIVPSNVEDGSIGTADLASGAVTTAKLAGGAVTGAKLADGSVTNDKLDSSIRMVALTNAEIDAITD